MIAMRQSWRIASRALGVKRFQSTVEFGPHGLSADAVTVSESTSKLSLLLGAARICEASEQQNIDGLASLNRRRAGISA